jgi:tetratricopeptide (TPR) repeat protein
MEDIARALGGLGDAHYQRGRLRTAQQQFRRCVALCDEHGMAGPRLSYLSMVAATCCYTCEFREAFEICERVVAAAQGIGDLRSELLAIASQASIEINRANYSAAAEYSARGLSVARELGARRFEAEALVLHGLSLRGLGRRAAAVETLRHAATLARSASPTYCGPWAFGALAAVEEDHALRLALLAESEALLERGCVSHNHLEFRWYAIQVSIGEGDAAGALRHAAALEDYTREEPLPWADHVAAWGRALATGRGMDEVREAARRVEFNALL